MLHFELNEFDSPDDQGSGKYMDESFLSMLDDARGIASIPFVINSGFRSKSHTQTRTLTLYGLTSTSGNTLCGKFY